MKTNYNAHFGPNIYNNDFTQCFFENLPDEIFSVIYNYIDFTDDKNNFSLVSKKWKTISDNNTKTITVFKNFENYQNFFIISQRLTYVEKVNIYNYGEPNLSDYPIPSFVFYPSHMNLKHFKNLTYLHLWENDLTDHYLENFTNLKILELNVGNIFSDESLKKLKNLTSLKISFNTSITYEAIKNLTKLTSLSLDCLSSISNDDMKKLTNLTSLSFDYQNSYILDKGISDEGIRNLTRLEHLDLSGNFNITNSALIKLTNLTSLDLSNTEIGNDPEIGNLINLRTLEISGVIVDSDIVNLTNLTELAFYADNEKITDNGISTLTNLTKFIFSPWADYNKLNLSGLKKLTYLDAVSIIDDDIIDLTNLQFLEIGYDSEVTANVIKTLTKLTHLVLQEDLFEVDWISHLTNLTYLKINESPRQEKILYIIQTLTNLRNLNEFKSLYKVSDVGLLPSELENDSLPSEIFGFNSIESSYIIASVNPYAGPVNLLPSETDGCSSPEIDDVDYFFL